MATPRTKRQPQKRPGSRSRARAAPPAEASGESPGTLLERVLLLALEALGHGTPPADVFFALQQAATILPLAEGAPREVVVGLARDIAESAADCELCRQVAKEIGDWLGRRRSNESW